LRFVYLLAVYLAAPVISAVFLWRGLRDRGYWRNFGERFAVSVNALNVANRRILLDNSLTFGGTHYMNPREIFAQVRYRFHY